MVHEIIYDMVKGKEWRFCGSIHVSTNPHGNILKVVACLNGNVYGISYPVIELSFMCPLNLFQ